jgi:pyridoxal phosphate enzyme (YggS family)
MNVAERVRRIRERILSARDRSPISMKSRPIVLVAATKGASLAQVQEAIDAGVDAIGENRLQELTAKFGAWRPPVPCHFIGRLQRNKVRLTLQWCDMIQSVDSLPLAEAIHTRHLELSAGAESSIRGAGGTQGRGRPILVQVNVAGEATKGGFAPEALEAAVERMAQWPGLAVGGLMTVPPYAPDPQEARPYFRRLRLLAERIAERRFAGVSMTTLSMGMSHDFEAAVEEGATMVRIGTALFGPRVG